MKTYQEHLLNFFAENRTNAVQTVYVGAGQTTPALQAVNIGLTIDKNYPSYKAIQSIQVLPNTQEIATSTFRFSGSTIYEVEKYDITRPITGLVPVNPQVRNTSLANNRWVWFAEHFDTLTQTPAELFTVLRNRDYLATVEGVGVALLSNDRLNVNVYSVSGGTTPVVNSFPISGFTPNNNFSIDWAFYVSPTNAYFASDDGFLYVTDSNYAFIESIAIPVMTHPSRYIRVHKQGNLLVLESTTMVIAIDLIAKTYTTIVDEADRYNYIQHALAISPQNHIAISKQVFGDKSIVFFEPNGNQIAEIPTPVIYYQILWYDANTFVAHDTGIIYIYNYTYELVDNSVLNPEAQAQITRLSNNLVSCPHTINNLRIVADSFEDLKNTKIRIVRYDAFGKANSSETIGLSQYLNSDLRQPIVNVSQLNGLEIDQNTGIELVLEPNSSASFLLDLEPQCVPQEVINLVEKPKEPEKKKRIRKRIIKRIRKCVCKAKKETKMSTETKMESSAIKVPRKDTSDAALILRLDRFIGTDKESLGKLYVKGFLQDNFECYIMEDEYRKDKIMAETRISQGTYEIKLATWGRHHAQYGARYPNDHVGMLILQDVPNFQGILIHQGTTEMDTAGCLLTGDDYEFDEARNRYKLIDSGKAYIRLYRKVAPLLANGERVFIKITDFDFGFKSSIYWLHKIRYYIPFAVLLGIGAFFAWKNRELIGKELGKMGVLK